MDTNATMNTAGKKQSSSMSAILLTFGVTVLVLAGIGTGYILAGKKQDKAASGSEDAVTESSGGNTIIGLKDVDLDEKDEAEGTLADGGINGEGTHHLEREGGASQNVYLTSSVINLNDFIGKKVRVWGDTNAAQKAGWLMDVVRLEVL